MYTTKGGSTLKQKLEEIETILEPVLTQEGVSLSDIEYVTEGKDHFLRIYIDKSGGVDLDDCTRVSEKASEQLDKYDPIQAAYFRSQFSDRKSTRLNSSHVAISYAVFCLKKKKKTR